MRVYRLQSRNPIVAALVVLLVLALLATVVVFGAVVLAGAAALGAGVVAVRRLTGKRPLPGGPPGALPPEARPLDPSREVFPVASDTRRLPPP